jgi:hypothetical protein
MNRIYCAAAIGLLAAIMGCDKNVHEALGPVGRIDRTELAGSGPDTIAAPSSAAQSRPFQAAGHPIIAADVPAK